MIRFAVSLLSLTLVGAAAPCSLAGPDHDHDQDHAHEQDEHKSLKELLPPISKPDLWIGSDAPELSIAKYLKGDAIGSLDKDQTYVVEFWATWCGPCIAAFPHLSELQEQYGDEVRFIGVNIWERVQGDERMAEVEQFVEDQGDRMGYTVAIERGESMSSNWMRPAGQNGIPAAFIVHKGKVAWIGHPMALDSTLEAVTDGSFDLDQAAEESWNDRVAGIAFQQYHGAIGQQEWDLAVELGEAMVRESFHDDPDSLNMLAWYAVSGKEAPQSVLNFGLRTAAQACKMTDWNNWMLLDTYARGMYETGDANSAVSFQKKAIELAKKDERVDERIMAQLESTLEEYGG